jgi:hypothetical protein
VSAVSPDDHSGGHAATVTATVWIGYGLWFWAAGFGLAHILYGIYVHLKVER